MHYFHHGNSVFCWPPYHNTLDDMERKSINLTKTPFLAKGLNDENAQIACFYIPNSMFGNGKVTSQSWYKESTYFKGPNSSGSTNIALIGTQAVDERLSEFTLYRICDCRCNLLCVVVGKHGARLSSLGLGLQGLYSTINCADNILGRFTIILQNQIARVDSFTNLTKRWVFRFRLNDSISSHNLISFGKQFHARGPYTANARLPKVSCLKFGTFRTRSSLDLMEYLLLFDGVIISWM